jgi:hypothetical protein
MQINQSKGITLKMTAQIKKWYELVIKANKVWNRSLVCVCVYPEHFFLQFELMVHISEK